MQNSERGVALPAYLLCYAGLQTLACDNCCLTRPLHDEDSESDGILI